MTRDCTVLIPSGGPRLSWEKALVLQRFSSVPVITCVHPNAEATAGPPQLWCGPRPTSRRRQARGRADRAVGEIAASGYVGPRLGAAPRHPVPAGGRFECRRTAKEARDRPSWAHYVSGKQARESPHCRGVARFQPLALGNSGGSVSARRCPYPNGDMRLACFLKRHAVKGGRGQGHRGFLSSGEDGFTRSGALVGESLTKRYLASPISQSSSW